MKKGFKSNATNTQKNSVRDKETISSKLKTGKDFKKMTMNDLSKNNSKIIKEKVDEKKKSMSNKPVSKLNKNNTNVDLLQVKNKQNFNSNNHIDLTQNKRSFKEESNKKNFDNNIKSNQNSDKKPAKKTIQTITITNTKLVNKQTAIHSNTSKRDSTKKLHNLRINSSNPNLNSPLIGKIGKRKNLKEELCLKHTESENSNLTTTEIIHNRASPKKTELTSTNIFNIDELPSKMSSSFMVKTQEIFPKLINNTFTKETANIAKNNRDSSLNNKNANKQTNKKIKIVGTFVNRNAECQRESLKNTRPKSEYKIKLDNANFVSNKNRENPLVKSFKTLDKRPHSGAKKADEQSVNNLANEASTSTEGSLFRGKIDDYIFGKEIGKGAYAIVKQATHKASNKKFAVKIYEKYKLLDPIRKNSVKREIEILKKVDHPSIVKLIEVIDTSKQILLVMELVNGVSLLTHLKAKPNRRMEEIEAKLIMKQILEGIKYLHGKNIFHRDVKLENLIIEELGINNFTVKIIDFGFAVVSQKTKHLTFFCGTPSYMPPEIVQKKDYLGPPADLWSCGILIYTLLCGSFPFRALNEKELYQKISKGFFNFPEHISNESKELIKRILDIHPNNRPTVENVLSDPWMKTEGIVIGSESIVESSKEIKLD